MKEVPYAAPPAATVSLTIAPAASSPEISPFIQAVTLSVAEIANVSPDATHPVLIPTSFAVPYLSFMPRTAL